MFEMQNRMTNTRIAIFAGLVILSFLFRFLIASSEVVYPDSCLYLSFVKAILKGKFSFDFLEGREVILPPLFPVFSAVFAFLGVSVELSGILVSAIAGALLIVPVFYIGKTVYNEEAAWVSAILVFISPVLIHWSGAILTESLFITLFISAIAIGLFAIEGHRKVFLWVCGAVIGLSYMTRVVGLILIPIISLWIIIYAIKTNKLADYRKIVKNIVTSAAIFVLGFIIVTAPYLVRIRSQYGHWTLAGGYGSITGVVAQEGAATTKAWEGLGSKKVVEESFVSKFIEKIITNLQDYSSALAGMLLFTVFFIVAGIFPRWKVIYTISFIVLYFSAFLALPSTPMLDERMRYLSPIFPLFLVVASGGIMRIQSWITWNGVKQFVMPVAVGIVLLSSILQAKVFPIDLHNLWDKSENVNLREQVGQWMKGYLPRPVRVMSRKPYIAYYADAEWFGTPPTYVEVLELARSKNVDYILIDKGIEYYLRPELRFLFDLKHVPSELEFVGGIRHPGTEELVIGIFKIKKS